MAKNRLYRVLSRVVEIKQGEAAIALFFFFFFFCITAPHTIIKSIRSAYFIKTVGAERLPIAYLLAAIVMGFVVAFHSRLQEKLVRRILLILSLIFFILNCFLFWKILPLQWQWMPFAFYIYANMFIYVLMTQFWFVVNDIFNPREVRRMVGFFTGGGVLGGIIGGILAGVLSPKSSESPIPYNLLLLASGLIILCGIVVNYIFVLYRRRTTAEKPEKAEDEGEKRPEKVGFKDCYDTVRKHYYLKLLAAMVSITIIVGTFIDFQFNTVIEAKYSANLTSFFGYFNAGILILPFFLSLFMTNALFKRYGIRIALLLFPFVLLLGSFGILILISLYFAIFLKGSDKSLSYTINQSVRELLYIPVSPEIKYRAKIFIDMFLNRFCKCTAALILLLITTFWEKLSVVRPVAIISFVFIMIWIVLNLKVSKEYVSTVKDKLKMKWGRADKLVAETVDLDYTKMVFDTIEAKDRSSALYAMHLFDLIKQDKLTPELKKLISYQSSEIRASSLDVILETEETTLMPETEDSISDDVLQKEVKEIMSLDVYQQVMDNYLEKVMEDQSLEGETAKMEVAKAVGFMDSQSLLAKKLEDLLYEDSPEISKYAVESAARLKRREYVAPIVQKLTSPQSRGDASAALEKYGQKIIGTLSDYLGDPEENIELRKALASVLASVGGQEAVDSLIWELAEDKRDMDAELIDAMDKIRTENPDVQFQGEIVRTKIAREIKKYYLSLIDFYESKSKESQDESEKDLPKNLVFSLTNIFKLLGLIYPPEDMQRAFQNIRTGTKDSVAYAVELIDNTLEKDIRDVILPIVEDLPTEQRVRRCKSLLRVSPLLRETHG